MAIDPASDSMADYDYAKSEVERPDLVDALDRITTGEVRFDTYTRELYATDASAYEVLPVGVVFPDSTGDVSDVMSYCADHDIPVLPRGGGTSLAGQSVNEAVVLDFSRHMDDLVDVDPGTKKATAEPGIYLGDLNRALEEHDLKFAPDPAWGDKSALGGAIGNNSSGSHSLVYGKTDAYLEELEVVLADGTITTFSQVTRDELAGLADPDGEDIVSVCTRVRQRTRRVTDRAFEHSLGVGERGALVRGVGHVASSSDTGRELGVREQHGNQCGDDDGSREQDELPPASTHHPYHTRIVTEPYRVGTVADPTGAVGGWG